MGQSFSSDGAMQAQHARNRSKWRSTQPAQLMVAKDGHATITDSRRG
jgi:hypothetical protein